MCDECLDPKGQLLDLGPVPEQLKVAVRRDKCDLVSGRELPASGRRAQAESAAHTPAAIPADNVTTHEEPLPYLSRTAGWNRSPPPSAVEGPPALASRTSLKPILAAGGRYMKQQQSTMARGT